MVDEVTTAQLQEWLERLANGDETACANLINLAYERLTILARRMFSGFPRLKSDIDASDVLHDSIPRLMHVLKAVRPGNEREFYGLAALQIRRVLLDMARKPPPPALLARDGENADPTESDTHDPRQLAIWTDFHRQIESLPPDERELAELLYYQELSQERVAEILGVDTSTVKRRWRAIRLKLGKQVKG
jgi:RNA polymerase sigma factor (sigma-70 family)